MSSLNLLKLISNPNTSPFRVEVNLKKVFSTVITRRTGAFRFFDFEFVCFEDNDRARLVVQYGWSPTKGWMFEPLRPRNK